MIYKGNEIFARVHKSYSDLHSLDSKGNLVGEGEEGHCLIDNGAWDIVWYEVEYPDNSMDFDVQGMGFSSIKKAKSEIDKYQRRAE